ncbi:translational GTPase TypA [Eubacterium sp.]|uniref:translational GTPase TypA n=1 Tax=Eubacterium sp. TaxID=142586 RepID=UPI0015A37E53|nr:translational GTPase TypA [Eubacterium sp.]MBD8928917.1 translational GTPase TypA [Clostridiales bacterium]MCI7801343.1 translational GTPase TypA [Eubacterium sp.]MDD7331512.1 translational GTPase TypA [Eubacterium sp.]MDY3811289.1 translational GTPase TypA [Eubacterium sp.]MDY5243276.1 translational GTPase TypA [Eubacterium sp.]
MTERKDIKNVAIIAHVDHGKTTLVDEMLHQSGIFRDNEVVEERVMDSNDLERERGITILSKNTSIHYKDTKINIVDTPGHADFGGEVERILTMVDGVLLLVDAFEGCMPQTRFVLKKALGLHKTPLVVVNKIDRDGARPEEVIDEVLDLFIELGADDDQIDFPVIYASARDGYSSLDPNVREGDMRPLLDAILEYIPSPKGDLEGPAQILFSSLEYDEYVGRIGVGRVERGEIKANTPYVLCRQDGTTENVKFSKIYQFEGLKRVETPIAKFGDLVSVAGIADLNIGETACDPDCIEPLPFVKIDEPTISMNFMVNDSPFAGREGKYVTSRNLRERLFKEVETNVSMRVEETDSMDTFKVSGRGELHLSILIETMRRENYEFQVSRPQVILKHDADGRTLEPIETAIIEVPEEYVGAVMTKLCSRKGEMVNMDTRSTGMTHMEIKIPSRGLIGYRSEFLTDTNGNGIMNQVFSGYEEWKGDIETRSRGSIVVHETGTTTGYGLWNTQDRGKLFVGPGVEVYEGMIVGECAKDEDIVCNVCKKKHVTNTRASGSDEALKLVPPTTLSLEQSMEFLADDELLEVTPKSIRLRKTILSKELRLKAESRARKG